MSKKRVFQIYVAAIAFVALANGLGDNVLANFYKDAYNIDALQRAFIEFPRELPGVLAVFVISLLARFGDLRIAMISQFLAMVGILLLAIFTPSFYTMTAMLFIYSMGTHVFMPLQDGIAIHLLSANENRKVGSGLGNIKGIITAFSLIASIIVVFGFQSHLFQLVHEIRWIFVFAALFYLIAVVLLGVVLKHTQAKEVIKPKFIIRKKYIYYYILQVMNGVQKQVFIVFAPWVIIDILGRGADTTAMLMLISSVCGIFFMPFLGKCLDRFGIRKMLYADALSFIGVYLAFAFMTFTIVEGIYSSVGIAAMITCALFVIDRMSSQMGFIRSVYLNSIIDNKEELVSTISFGICLDHVVAIVCSFFSGLIWVTLGAHYIFILAASFSIVNLVIAKIVPLNE